MDETAVDSTLTEHTLNGGEVNITKHLTLKKIAQIS